MSSPDPLVYQQASFFFTDVNKWYPSTYGDNDRLTMLIEPGECMMIQAQIRVEDTKNYNGGPIGYVQLNERLANGTEVSLSSQQLVPPSGGGYSVLADMIAVACSTQLGSRYRRIAMYAKGYLGPVSIRFRLKPA